MNASSLDSRQVPRFAEGQSRIKIFYCRVRATVDELLLFLDLISLV
jgi:hypothetical protein